MLFIVTARDVWMDGWIMIFQRIAVDTKFECLVPISIRILLNRIFVFQSTKWCITAAIPVGVFKPVYSNNIHIEIVSMLT